ncbi:MAG: hypothetical protein AAF790_15445, partial [Planctomycetota bacterium]
GGLFAGDQQDAEGLLKTAVYDVRDLCRDEGEGDALIAAIVSQVASTVWAENGGGAAEIRFARDGVMVVSQTEKLHGELLVLLDRYRDALRQSKPRVAPGPDPAEVLTRYYRLPAAMADALQQGLPRLVGPGTWAGATNPDRVGRVVAVVPSEPNVDYQKLAAPRVTPHKVLIVEQTRAVHEAIEGLITRLRSGDGPLNSPPVSGGLGGGGGGFGGGAFSVEPRTPRPTPTATPAEADR